MYGKDLFFTENQVHLYCRARAIKRNAGKGVPAKEKDGLTAAQRKERWLNMSQGFNGQVFGLSIYTLLLPFLKCPIFWTESD